MGEGFPQAARQIMNERFRCDALYALATVEDGRPFVRAVNGYYEDVAIYVITHALSNKMRQIGMNPPVSICGEWFTASGTGENLGHILDEKNHELAEKLRNAFAEWYGNGHTDESDPNTCILRIRLTSGVLLSRGIRYDIDFQ